MGSIYGEEEIEACVAAIRESMDPLVGFGMNNEVVEDFENAFAAYIGTKYMVACNGAGTGIDMAMRLLDVKPGDEVITQCLNFRAVPLAALDRGAKVVFAEIDPDTLQLDPNDVEKRITPRTRAIVPTHMNGMSAPMRELLELAERYPHQEHGPIKVIGDAARACGAGREGTKVGKLGWMNIFSFHTMKNMTTLGEGGGVTTDDWQVVEQMHRLRQFGGGGDSWGSNYKMSKCQAAVGLIQLAKLDDMIAARRRLGLARNSMLEGCPGLTLPLEPKGDYHSYYLYSMLVPKDWAGAKRDRLIALMQEDYGVGLIVANAPVQERFAYVARLTKGQDLPISHEVGQRLVCASVHPAMSDEDNEYIAAAIWEAVERIRAEG
jgi:dTDP-4-amino-4,6-dideoxygalactose transaminase